MRHTAAILVFVGALEAANRPHLVSLSARNGTVVELGPTQREPVVRTSADTKGTPGCGSAPLGGKTGCDAECAGLAYVAAAGICTGCMMDGTTAITADNVGDLDPPAVLCDGTVELGSTQPKLSVKRMLRAREEPLHTDNVLVRTTVDQAIQRKGNPRRRRRAPPPPPANCPNKYEVLATPYHYRWAVWDDPSCTVGCRDSSIGNDGPHCWVTKPGNHGAIPAGCSIGDGNAPSEEYLTTTTSMAECKNYVSNHRPFANGATWGWTSHYCYAEFGQSGASGNTWMNCPVDPIPAGCQIGDGSGGVEKHLTSTNTAQECRDYVAREQPSANGATWGPSNKQCYAEFGQTGAHGTGWVNCPVSAMPAGCQPGDGSGGAEKHVTSGMPTVMACAEYVSRTQPSANGATWGPINQNCYAEFGQTGTTGGTGSDWINCAVTPAIAQFGAGECKTGDGNGGIEIHIGDGYGQMQDCADAVPKKQPSANGATWAPSSGACWAEFGQSGVHSPPSTSYHNCPVTPMAPIGCSAGNGDGAEVELSETTTMQECIDLVSLREPSANGASWSPEYPNKCYAEIGQHGASGEGMVNCPVTPIAPAGCSEGEGVNGDKVTLSSTPTMHACLDLVIAQHPAANGATWSPDSSSCVAEFGQEGSGGTGWVNCPVEPTCEPGDGLGSHELDVGDFEKIYECYEHVRVNNPSANGATYGVSNKHCWAEFGQNGTDGASKYLNCALVPTAALPTLPPPPNVTCDAAPGDGSGPSSQEEFVDRVDSMQACAEAVVTHKPTANGATYSNVTRKCYAEFSQSEVKEPVAYDINNWMNCYVSAPLNIAPTAPPCVDATQRVDLVYMTKMDILKANEDLQHQATLMQQELQHLRNVYGEHEAIHARVKVKYNSTDAFCAVKKAQIDAYEKWVDAEMASLKAECDRAEGLSSEEFQAHLDKVLELVKRKLID